jgi:hypothetical protein
VPGAFLRSQDASGARKDRPVADPKTYTQEEYDALLQEKEALKANRDEALTEAKRAKAALKAWDGKDPAKYDELLRAAEEAEQRKAAAEGDFTTLKNQLVQKHESEIATRNAREKKLEAALQKRLVQAELTAAIAAKRGVPELLLPYAEKFARVRETDDDFEAYLADEKGQPMYADGRATPLDFGTFVEQHLMTKFPRAFDGTGSSGGGASKSIPGGGGNGVIAGTNSPDFLNNLADIAAGKMTVAG